MTILLVEGVVATGKTTILGELQRTDLWRERPTKILLSEHYTERVLELTTPTVAARVELLTQHVDMAEDLHRLWSGSRFSHERNLEPLIFFERFHLTHAAQIADLAPFIRLEERLLAMGALLLFLHHPPCRLLERIKATERVRSGQWKLWLRSLGSDEDIAHYFLSLQENSASIFAQSRLKKFALEAHSIPPTAMAEKVSQLLRG